MIQRRVENWRRQQRCCLDKEDAIILESLLDNMKKNVKNSTTFVTADLEFHMASCKAQGNPITAEIMQEVTIRYSEEIRMPCGPQITDR